MTRVHVGLGSNLEDPRRQIERAFEALAALPETVLAARSSLYRSAPMGPADQPDYLNAVAALDTQLAPLPLLDALQEIERAQRRVRGRRWGPRTLDLDLLLYGDRQIDLPRLQVPHPGMHQRCFVLLPLLEVAGDIEIPERGRVSVLLPCCGPPAAFRLDD
ncbi:2-amino-4-hydroxy-6-hydroxymethyldihydropteridine diphosphokinase [endosymbiont of unidentified scaly snail isolate Monju]|uniref:2-amino-4-hydroxy-6- hydroxymethyldihydropteridine diphosphokinase n=1 Tax=endosymbiont of unidentified scaly snail isolate Monju TaxID=1248727 RepID=UPI0003891A85|nr:2-amino-4-hydroxy-6-hydroxymethyldihydropteridine diphosphokinase [endosymbiont of unidentified scaly snail isolate Monju]BAN69323.1 2-amino-4-hydroxy-6-hydroxymethyldihydropteridine diphosphokinase [endosymbiont of unidentified scaly snail isolate Monju]